MIPGDSVVDSKGLSELLFAKKKTASLGRVQDTSVLQGEPCPAAASAETGTAPVLAAQVKDDNEEGD